MTASIREQITAEVFALLQSTTGVGGRVYRSRVGSGQAFGVVQLLDFGLPERPPTATAVGQEWTSPDGTLYRVAQAFDDDGQFLPDDPQTPQRESLGWVEVAREN